MRARSLSLLLVVLCAFPARARDVNGFPASLGEGTNRSSPAVGDIDGDGRPEIVVGHGEMLHVIEASGSPRAGFPVKLGNLDVDAKKFHASSPALCALDGGKRRSIVSGGPDDKLYVTEPDGRARAGFPIAVGAQIEAAPLCADVDADGKNDIIVSVPGREVVGFDASGKRLPGFPLKGVMPAESAIAAGDIVVGGTYELLVGGDDGQLYLFDGKGVVDRERRARTNYKISGGPSLGDVDGDGRIDIVFGSQDFNLYAVDAASWELRPGFPVVTGYRIYGSPALGDLNGDGKNDIVVGSADGLVYATDGNGKPLLGWPVKVDGKVAGSVAIGDLDLDGKLEVVAVSTTGKTYVLGIDGRSIRGTPFLTPGENFTSPVIADLDGKEGPEVVVVGAKGKVYVFNLRPTGKLSAARIPWPTYAHDAERVARMRPNAAVFDALRIEPSPLYTTDALDVAYTFRDLDGAEEPGTRIVWFVDGKRAADLDNVRQVPAARTKKGQKWSVRIQEASDYEIFKEGNGAVFHASTAVVVDNTPPEAPRLAPVTPLARHADAITVRVASESKDVDDDVVKYRTIWSVDEIPSPLDKRALTFPAKKATRGQRVKVIVVPEDDRGDGEPASMTWTIANTAPSSPTIALQPASPTRATGAKLVIQKAGVDVDGDRVRHDVVWTLDGRVLPLSPSSLEVPGGLLVRGGRLAAKVVAHDGFDPSTPSTAEVVIGNTPPGQAVVALAPAAPRGGAPLSVVVTGAASDADGDTPTLGVKWTLDGAAQADLDGVWTVPAARVKKAQRWRAIVTADDGAARGKDVTVDVTVGNRVPVAPVVSLSPLRPRSDEAVKLDVTTAATDPDGDAVKNQIEWRVDGTVVAAALVDALGLKAGAAKKGQTVEVRVTPFDGKDVGPSTGDVVVVGDRVPLPPRVALAPAAPKVTEDVRVVVNQPGSDPDGDAVTLVHHFFVNGARVELKDDATTLPARRFRAGDKIEVQVWSRADGAFSEPARAEATAVPTPPPAPSVAIEPSMPLPGEPLRVRIVSQTPDVDGANVRYEAKWTNNGRAVESGMAGIAGATTKKGERWRVEVTAVDDDGRSPAASAEATIGNQPPIAPRIRLSKEQVTTTEQVELEVVRAASDTDGDKVQLEIQWKKNGAVEASLAGRTAIPSDATKKGDLFEVEVVANDGIAKSPGVRAEFRVVDTPPTPPKIAFAPTQPIAGEDVSVTVSTPGSDVDGDTVTHRIEWLIDGKTVKQKPDAFTLPGKLAKAKSELVAVVVAVADKRESLPVRAFAEVASARPDSPKVSITPEKPIAGDTLVARVDAPQDRELPAVVEIRWNVNGKSSPHTGPVVPGDKVRKGETWQAVALTVVDAKQSLPVTAEVKVGNRPPKAPVIALSSRRVKTTDSVKLTVSKDASDPDGDAVTLDIRWSKNGKRVTSLDGAREVPSKETQKGDVFTVQVEARDGSDSAPVVTDGFVVEDTAPPGVQVTLEPARPKAGENLTARIALTGADADGDKVTYRVRYLVNGVRAASHDGKSPELSAASFKRDDLVVVEVEPFDGERAGPIGRASARAENVGPVIAGVSIAPSAPTAGDALKCVPNKAPTDADNDPLTLHVTWSIDGRVVAAGPDAPLEKGRATSGQKVSCAAFVSDGVLVSSSVTSTVLEMKSRAPVGIEATLEPAAPVTGDVVTCGVRGAPVDPDGDAITIDVSALVNGRATGSARTEPVTAGQVVECKATAKDGRVTGAEVVAKATVGNARPLAGVPRLSTSWPRAGVDDLTCAVAEMAKDPEGDKLLYRIEWFKNGQPAGLPPNQNKLTPKMLVAGDMWVCRLIAQDAGGDGPSASTEGALVRPDPNRGNPTRRVEPSSAKAK
jgi:hypothetical protein